MPNNRSLIVVNSVYQLMTAVHLKQTLLEKEDTDLILTDNSPGLKGYAPRIETMGLFRRIFFAATKELNKKYTTAKEKKITQGFQRISEIFPLILTDDLGMYTQIYFANFDIFTRMLAYRYDCEFHCFEDGFSTYVIDYLRESRAAINRHPDGKKLGEKLVDVLLYEPRLAMRGDGLTNRPLPKIQIDDYRLREAAEFYL